MSPPIKKWAVQLEKVTAQYPGGFQALNELTFNIPQGAFYGLLGLNGAGKSTTISVLEGLLPIQNGKVHLFGQPLSPNSPNFLQIKRMVGWMPQHLNLHPFETVEEVLLTEGGYHGLSYLEAKVRMLKLLSVLSLKSKKSALVRQLSGGMKRRLLLARALIHKPQLLVLDEPSAGLDLETRKLMWEYLRFLNHSKGVSFLLTTHYLEEAEQLCSHVGILKKGHIVAEGPTMDLLNRLDSEEVRIELSSPLPLDFPLEGLEVIARSAETINVLIKGSNGLSNCMQALTNQNLFVRRAQPVINRLEYGLLNPKVFSEFSSNDPSIQIIRDENV